MKSSSLATAAFAAASILVALAAPAIAQTYYEPKPPVYDNSADIIVTAPGVIRYDTGRRTSSGAPIETVTAQRVVETADLDLRYNKDVRELRARIRDNVADACREVETHVQTPLDTERDCIRAATNDAMAQADDLISTARG
ncbi:MAG: UrcA family protein [Terricaulis sp.]